MTVSLTDHTAPMPYIQSPTGIYHKHPRHSQRTKCGIRITEDWTAKDSKPNPLTHTCDRCEETFDRVEGIKRFDSRGERKAQKIRQMQRDAKETPKRRMKYPDEPETKVVTAEDADLLASEIGSHHMYTPVSVTSHDGELVCVLIHKDCR